MSAPTRYKVAAGTAVAAGLLRIAYPYLSRDYHAFRQTSSFLKAARVYLDSKRYIVDMFEEAAAHNPYKTFIIYENTIYTYGDINRMANKFANFVRKKGLKLGDCAAVLMYNEPSFIWSYLGFAKLGIRVAFLNYNLRLDPLVHCIDVSEAKVVIVGHDPELIPAVEGIFSQLQDRGVDVWITGGSYDGPYTHIDNHLSSMSEQPIPRDTRRSLTESDISVYIFTSGTTGHPKASKITYYRQLMAAFMLSPVGITANDRTYISLPLYHSSASMLSFSTVLRTQSTIVLARKLSVRRFWEDCRRHGVTVIFYIGETCRYLLSLPP
ncbi:long-chain fatty acid transport protein 2-like, partial [Saccoglossus kowalevskii]|uniref:Long-chain-fatty-acid--CoA ligase n=1 Tax=Saccoglossus kowalevskii TaxID=10224 RepID=A0ABM0M5S0_SACKO